MGKRLFVLLNHALTASQRQELEQEFHIDTIVSGDDAIKSLWEQIPPEGELQLNRIKELIVAWLEKNARERDYVLVQGEFGASFFLVDYCFHRGLIPIYGTSCRVYSEVEGSEGNIVRSHVYRHVRFRKYQRWR